MEKLIHLGLFLASFGDQRLRTILTDERGSMKNVDCHRIRGFFRPTIQPTTYDVLYDFRVFWQSPQSCKLL